jgi:predicted nucleic-acid-binding protein
MKIAFDTNYLLRHIMQDDEAQAEIVADVLKQEAGAGRAILIQNLVLAETVWTLASYYGLKRADIAEVLGEILNDSAFEMESPARTTAALKRFKSGRADFPDYLISEGASERGAKLLSFDRKLCAE